jgi:hypothetical protein
MPERMPDKPPLPPKPQSKKEKEGPISPESAPPRPRVSPNSGESYRLNFNSSAPSKAGYTSAVPPLSPSSLTPSSTPTVTPSKSPRGAVSRAYATSEDTEHKIFSETPKPSRTLPTTTPTTDTKVQELRKKQQKLEELQQKLEQLKSQQMKRDSPNFSEIPDRSVAGSVGGQARPILVRRSTVANVIPAVHSPGPGFSSLAVSSSGFGPPVGLSYSDDFNPKYAGAAGSARGGGGGALGVGGGGGGVEVRASSPRGSASPVQSPSVIPSGRRLPSEGIRPGEERVERAQILEARTKMSDMHRNGLSRQQSEPRPAAAGLGLGLGLGGGVGGETMARHQTGAGAGAGAGAGKPAFYRQQTAPDGFHYQRNGGQGQGQGYTATGARTGGGTGASQASAQGWGLGSGAVGTVGTVGTGAVPRPVFSLAPKTGQDKGPVSPRSTFAPAGRQGTQEIQQEGEGEGEGEGEDSRMWPPRRATPK